MATLMKVFSVTEIQIMQVPDRNTTIIVVQGQVSTSGWSNAQLKAGEGELSADGILDLDFLAEPPVGVSLPAFFPISAQFEWDNGNGKLRGVKVHARTDTPTSTVVLTDPMIELLPSPMRRLTTLAIGEESHLWPRPVNPKEFYGETWPSPMAPKALVGESGPLTRETDEDIFRAYRRSGSPFPPRDGGT
jgi:hypothetical protein